MTFISALLQAGYVQADAGSVLMKPDYAGIAYSDGDATEERIGAIIAAATDCSVFSVELAAQCTDWPSLYHLAASRANILRPFRLMLEQADVLEIGAGCGAVTRYLGESGARVLALEGSVRRAAIARSRTRDLENVTVVADRFDRFSCDYRFDVVTLIGVLEYAALFTEGDDPAVNMLRQVRALLKPGGRLILAIENQLGLKYFAGAREDHKGEPMFGIEGRYARQGPQTFGRKKLAALLETAGFVSQQFLAPFPDYKLPVSILTEQGLACDSFDTAALAWQSAWRDPQLPPHLTFAPELVWPVVADNGLILDLANSFLVVAGTTGESLPDATVLAHHYSTGGRRAVFCKETLFVQRSDDSIALQYRPLGPAGQRSAEGQRVRFHVPSEAEYSQGQTLALELLRIATRDGWRLEEVGAFLQRYLAIVAAYIASAAWTGTFASVATPLPGTCFDLVPQNIIITPDGSWQVIDQEWAVKEEMPLGWLLFRTLLLLVTGLTRFGRPADEFETTRQGFFIAAYGAAGFAVTPEQLAGFAILEGRVQADISGCSADNDLRWAPDAPLVRQPLQLLVEGGLALAGRDEHIRNLTQHTENLEQRILKRDERIHSLARHADSLSQTATETEKQKTSLSRLVAEKETMIRERDALIKELYALLKEKELFLESILTSKSWQLTKPLRSLMLLLKQPAVPKVEENNTAAAPPAETTAKQAALPAAVPPSSTNDKVAVLDVEFYTKAYPDIRGMDLYNHYEHWGQGEGRLARAPELFNRSALDQFDPMKDTVLVVSHEASRTGAPILALNIAATLNSRYNVVVLCLKGGDLLDDFRKACTLLLDPIPGKFQAQTLLAILDPVLPLFNFKFAIVNSIVSKTVLPALACHFVPTLCLVHEFASYTHPRNAIREVLFWAGRIVFSAGLVFENNARECEELRAGGSVILAQGKCAVPAQGELENADADKLAIRKAMRPDSFPADTVLILGAGSVHIRKGVDLFIACAARVLALQPSKPFRFVWVGSGFNPEVDLAYSVYLQDQIDRAGLTEYLCFVEETPEIDLVYSLSDVLLLSSRLDPLPNVAIDAMCQGLPVVCFDHTTGIADLLKENGLGEQSVMPYLDVEHAAQRLAMLIDQTEERRLLGEKMREVGRVLFDMQGYVRTLEGLAGECAARRDIEQEDFFLIKKEQAIDSVFCRPASWAALDDSELIRAYLRSWSSSIDRRKPFAGFHPGLYLEHHGVDRPGRDPLADFLRAGCPDGPWLTALIEPSAPASVQQDGVLRAALHVHVFFADLFADIYERLAGQPLALDLLISVPSVEVADEVATLTREYANGSVDIRQVPNRGRDIGPLLTEFGADILKHYDLIGHVHTKKSGDVRDAKMGQQWFTFLLENLVGGQSPMASIILGRLAGDEGLGLVFPDDPNFVGWNKNRELADELARELGILELPGEHFNFPVGTMFWARARAIEPLLARHFKWADYPEEPLPYDGTKLHAIERLLPALARQTGYRIALTHVPGVTR
jgi:glycosyltransferase involved in cell wall biosynthesis/SAM-dependent methyltransferase